MANTFTLNKIEFHGSLAEPAVFEEVSLFVDLIKDSGSIGDIYKLVRELEHLLQVNKDQLGENNQKYLGLLTTLRLDSFQLLSDGEIGDILKNKMSEAQKNEIDLTKAAALIFVPFFTQEDYARVASMLRYLEENTEIIGNASITLPDGKEAGPLVSNWLKDYKSRIPEDKGSLNVIEYITHSDNCKKINQEQIEFLKYILNFYDWLRFRASKVSFVNEEGPAITSVLQPLRTANIPKPQAPPVARPSIPAPQVPRPQPVQVPRPAPIPPAPARPAEVAKPASDFDKKLAAVAAPPARLTNDSVAGRDLELMRRQMDQKPILAAKPPAPPVPAVKPAPAVSRNIISEEIKREVGTDELPPHQEPAKPVFKPMPAPVVPKPRPPTPPEEKPKPVVKPVTVPVAPKPVFKPVPVPVVPKQLTPTPSEEKTEPVVKPVTISEVPKPAVPKPPASQPMPQIAKSSLQSIDQISVIDDLKKVDISNLRQGPIGAQIKTLKAKILMLASANKLLPYYTVTAFEQSPLFNAYLQVGSAIIDDNNPDRAESFKSAAAKVGSQLTLEEFEAIVDLKQEIEGL